MCRDQGEVLLTEGVAPAAMAIDRTTNGRASCCQLLLLDSPCVALNASLFVTRSKLRVCASSGGDGGGGRGGGGGGDLF